VQARGPENSGGRSLTLTVGYNGGQGAHPGTVNFGLDGDFIWIGGYTTATVNDGLWHHVVGVFSGASGQAVDTNQFTVYVDGQVAPLNAVKIDSGTAPTAPVTGGIGTRLGRHDAWNLWYTGGLDEVAVYPAALSANRISAHYATGRTAPTPTPTATATATVPPTPTRTWVLTFEDDFTGTKLDATKWNNVLNAEAYNGEQQIYLPANVSVGNGNLRLTSLGQDYTYNGTVYHYTSGRVDTNGKFSQLYGKFEVRARLPKTQGMWPAHWLLPAGMWPPERDRHHGTAGERPDHLLHESALRHRDQPRDVLVAVHGAGLLRRLPHLRDRMAAGGDSLAARRPGAGYVYEQRAGRADVPDPEHRRRRHLAGQSRWHDRIPTVPRHRLRACLP
jgi:hypothetical protein